MTHVETLAACISCYEYLANGENEGTPGATIEAIDLLSRQYPAQVLVPSGDGEEWLSWTPCHVCGSSLGGTRNEVGVLAPDK